LFSYYTNLFANTFLPKFSVKQIHFPTVLFCVFPNTIPHFQYNLFYFSYKFIANIFLHNCSGSQICFHCHHSLRRWIPRTYYYQHRKTNSGNMPRRRFCVRYHHQWNGEDHIFLSIFNKFNLVEYNQRNICRVPFFWAIALATKAMNIKTRISIFMVENV